jgi:mitogen-activated protein kinase 1/3
MPMQDVAAALPAVPAPAAAKQQQQPPPQPQPEAKPKEKEKRKIRFSVGTEYRVEEIIGEGAYGVVCSATHIRTGVRVAIKKVSPFDHSSECTLRLIAGPRKGSDGVLRGISTSADPFTVLLRLAVFALRTLREVKLLRYFAENQVSENLITIVDVIKPSSYDAFKEASRPRLRNSFPASPTDAPWTLRQVYLIQELMETDLYRVIKTQQLSDDQ